MKDLKWFNLEDSEKIEGSENKLTTSWSNEVKFLTKTSTADVPFSEFRRWEKNPTSLKDAIEDETKSNGNVNNF